MWCIPVERQREIVIPGEAEVEVYTIKTACRTQKNPYPNGVMRYNDMLAGAVALMAHVLAQNVSCIVG
jgi:hypothetical protein